MPLKTNAADGSSMSDLLRKLIFFLLLPQLLRRPCSSPTCIYIVVWWIFFPVLVWRFDFNSVFF